MLYCGESEQYGFGYPKLMHSKAALRTAIAAVVTGLLLGLSLFLYSPWHRHPAQGRQACPFFHIEQNSPLQASGHVNVEPPQVERYYTPEVEACDSLTPLCRQYGGRAPPA